MESKRKDMTDAKLLYYANKFKIDSITKMGIDVHSFTQIYLMIRENIRKKEN